jgi:hypothetical protein
MPASAAPAAGNGEASAERIPRWSFAADSQTATLECSGFNATVCCRALENLRAGACGEARFVAEKNRWKQDLGEPVQLLGAEAFRPPSGDGESRIELTAVLGKDARGSFRFQRRAPDGDGSPRDWCDSGRGCLTSETAQPALREGRVFPVFSGRVTAVDSTPAGYRVTVYHGRELYTHYAFLRRLKEGIRAGAVARQSMPLGEAARDSLGDSSAVRFERAGMTVDPAEFSVREGG